MILVAGGDSFIWGSELKDSLHGGPSGYSRNTFPALLAQQANMDYHCAAYPGSANSAISRLAIGALEKIPNEKFLLVQWTYSQRAEFKFNEEWVSINSWISINGQNTEVREFSKQYFKYINSEYYEVYSALKEIVFLQQYCQINQIPYMFMTADNYFHLHELYYRREDTDINNLHKQIDWTRWFWFPAGTEPNETLAPRGFYQWALENKYSIGADGHPLEQAHLDTAELIKEKFNELVKKSI